jgi:acyl carrier protein
MDMPGERDETRAIKDRLATILAQLTAVNEMVRADADLREDSFGAIGLTSVDYLEFILNVEADLGIDVPDEALMDPALASVRHWAAYLARHRSELATPLVGAPSA